MNNIILRGFENVDLVTNFSQGKEPFMLSNPARIPIDNKTSMIPVLSKTIGDKNTESIYEYREDHGRKVQVHTTQGNLYLEMLNSDGKVLPMGGYCMYHGLPFETQSYGFPIKYEEVSFTVPNEQGEPVHFFKHIFHVEGMFCGFPCALAHVNQFLSGRSHEASINCNARMLLLQQFSIMHPGMNLQPAKNRGFLKHFGGTMEFDEWMGENFTLVPMNHIIYSPTKLAYVRIEDQQKRQSTGRMEQRQSAKAATKLQAVKPLAKANAGNNFAKMNLFTIT